MDFIAKNLPVKLTDLVLVMPEITSHTLRKDLLYLKSLQFIDSIGKYKGTIYIKRKNNLLVIYTTQCSLLI